MSKDSDTVGHDNPGYESKSRKNSLAVEEAENATAKKKRIGDEFELHSLQLSEKHDETIHTNDETNSRKPPEKENIGSPPIQLCPKCQSNNKNLPPWSPKHWPKFCAYSYCPSYRLCTRTIGICSFGLLLWCVLYSILGSSAAPPDGKLFQLGALSICAYIGGWLISLIKLPPLIGMLFVGMLLQNVNVVDIDDTFTSINKVLRNIALVVILTRAGLSLNPNALRRLWLSLIKVGLGPWTIEVIITMVMSVYLLDLPWTYAALLGFIIAAVSPAVIVPCLFRLKSEGYGIAKGIPTLVIAIAGIDGAASVTGFGIMKNIIFSSSSLTMLIIGALLSIVGGVLFGVLWGYMSSLIPEKTDPILVPLRVLLLLVAGLASVFGTELIGYGGSGPVACIAAAFTSVLFWCRQGWTIESNPVSSTFALFWMFIEPVLFGITGASVRFNQIDVNILWICVGIIVAGVGIKSVATIFLGIGCGLNWKEKIFVAIACIAKATVQAALGPAIYGLFAVDSIEYEYGKKVLNVCVLSIIITAPIGAILTALLGPRLLSTVKTEDSEEHGKDPMIHENEELKNGFSIDKQIV